MCGCKSKVSGMARKKSSRSTKVTMEDGLAVAAGAVVSVVANKLINSYIPAGQAEMLGKVIPVVKAAGGIFLATKSKDRRLKMAGLGMAATGAIELGQKFASLTEIPLSISGGYGDQPAMLGVENMQMANL